MVCRQGVRCCSVEEPVNGDPATGWPLTVRYAVAGIAGRFAAFAILIGLVTLGLGAFLARPATAFEIIRWLGITTLKTAGKASRDGADPSRVRYAVATRQEFITALSNPKALLLFASFVPQFLPAGGSAGTLALLAVVYVCVEAVASVLYLFVGRGLRRADGQLRMPHRRLDRVAGVGFLGFGCYLATAQRP